MHWVQGMGLQHYRTLNKLQYRNTLVVVLQKMWKNMNNTGNRSSGLLGPIRRPDYWASEAFGKRCLNDLLNTNCAMSVVLCYTIDKWPCTQPHPSDYPVTTEHVLWNDVTCASKATDTQQTNVGQQMLDNSMAEMADSADDDDVAAAVISVIARKRKRRRPKSVLVQSWIMQR